MVPERLSDSINPLVHQHCVRLGITHSEMVDWQLRMQNQTVFRAFYGPNSLEYGYPSPSKPKGEHSLEALGATASTSEVNDSTKTSRKTDDFEAGTPSLVGLAMSDNVEPLEPAIHCSIGSKEHLASSIQECNVTTEEDFRGATMDNPNKTPHNIGDKLRTNDEDSFPNNATPHPPHPVQDSSRQGRLRTKAGRTNLSTIYNAVLPSNVECARQMRELRTKTDPSYDPSWGSPAGRLNIFVALIAVVCVLVCLLYNEKTSLL